jgi:hypothetical protein
MAAGSALGGAGSSARSLAEGEVYQLGDALGAVDGAGPLAARVREGDLVRLLEAAEAAGRAVGGAAEHDQGHRALRCHVHGRHRVRESRSRAHDEHAGLLTDVAPRRRHEARRLLVATVHDPDPGFDGARHHLDHRAGDYAEDRVDARRRELSGGELSSIRFRHRDSLWARRSSSPLSGLGEGRIIRIRAARRLAAPSDTPRGPGNGQREPSPPTGAIEVLRFRRVVRLLVPIFHALVTAQST